MDNQSPIELSADCFLHEQAAVRFRHPDLGRFKVQTVSSCVQQSGMLVEIYPPLGHAQPFITGGRVELSLRLPHQTEIFQLSAKVKKLLPCALDLDGKELSLLALSFSDLPRDVTKRLHAHAIAVTSAIGHERSQRVPVRFVVEPSGIDTMTPLHALDLSMTGMFVGGRARFSIGKVMGMVFRLPFQRTEVSVTGRVVWVGEKRLRGEAVPEAGFGFQFTKVPPEARTAIATYYARFDPA